MPGPASGSAMEKKRSRARRAAPRRLRTGARSVASKARRMLRTRSGKIITAVASAAPVVVKARWMPNLLQQRAHRAAPAEQHQQQKTHQHRRQDDRQMGDAVQNQPAGKARPRQSKGHGDGERQRPDQGARGDTRNWWPGSAVRPPSASGLIQQQHIHQRACGYGRRIRRKTDQGIGGGENREQRGILLLKSAHASDGPAASDDSRARR